MLNNDRKTDYTMKRKYVFECDDDKVEIVKSMMKSEFGIEVNELRRRKNSRFAEPVGPGFGDKLWRVNYEMDSIEASFSKPCWQSKALKAAGFVWCHGRGLWFSTNESKNEEVCNMLKLVQTDSVAKK